MTKHRFRMKLGGVLTLLDVDPTFIPRDRNYFAQLLAAESSKLIAATHIPLLCRECVSMNGRLAGATPLNFEAQPRQTGALVEEVIRCQRRQAEVLPPD